MSGLRPEAFFVAFRFTCRRTRVQDHAELGHYGWAGRSCIGPPTPRGYGPQQARDNGQHARQSFPR